MDRYLEYLEMPQLILGQKIKTLKVNSHLNNYEITYLEGLYAYLAGDIVKLEEILKDANSVSDSSTTSADAESQILDNKIINLRFTVLKLLELRYLIRIKNLGLLQKVLNDMIGLNVDICPAIYRGEKYFIMARASEILLDQPQAALFYVKAAHYYQEQNLQNKQLKSLFNSLICRERFNDKINMQAYTDILAIAIKQKDRSVMGAILNNIAYRMLFIGAYSSSLKLLTQSLKTLKYEQAGLNFHLAELNLAHLYLLLGYQKQFELLISKLSNSPFPEIKVAVEFLQQRIPQTTKQNISEGWLWRLKKQLSSLEELSELEDRLVGYLSLAPRQRADIYQFLWPKLTDIEIVNARFKMVLQRLKTKRPGIILFKESYYFLSLDLDYQNLKLQAALPVLNQNTEIKTLALSGDEQKFNQLLQIGPLTFNELLEEIYLKANSNSAYSIDKLVGRLKNLISRIRKKYPQHLRFRCGKYYWSY